MDFVQKVKRKYDYFSDEEAEEIVNRAKSILVEQLYPHDLSVNHSNFEFDKYPRFDMWILDCVDELVERTGMSSFVSYRENGMSYELGRAQVSQALLDRIPRLVGVVR